MRQEGRDEGRENGQGLGLLPPATHQQLLGDELHDQFLGPLLCFPGATRREVSGGCKPQPAPPLTVTYRFSP